MEKHKLCIPYCIFPRLFHTSVDELVKRMIDKRFLSSARLSMLHQSADKALDIVEVPDDLKECAVSDLVKILCKLIVYPCIFDTIELLHCKQGLAWQASCMARSEFVMIAQYTDKVIRYVGAVGQTTIF